MGKSPGRWMKTLIFGKKSSRSKNPKQNHEKRDVPVPLDQRTNLKTEENLNSKVQVFLSATPELNAQNDSNRIREKEEAAIDLQAALRGYLARRKFQKLKGIIRLQAFIRGHLVRRQAVSTLHCMFQIVKFQALARGRKIRSSNIGIQSKKCNRLVLSCVEVNRSTQILKLSSNKFAQKILASSPTPMPLHFQYNSNESNSVLSWLDRWSTSRCWHLHLHPNPKSGDLSKPHTRRSSVTNIASEFDKSILNLRKVSSKVPENCIEENPELVLEKVKRNLRKVNSSVLQSTNDSIQKMITVPEELWVINADAMIIRKNEKDDERRKLRPVVCVPVKQRSTQNDEPSQIKRSVPGYMAPTVSAKAKLRGQYGPEYLNTLTRRHSLPSNLPNPSISVSPMAKTTGKLTNDASLQLSRDGSVSERVNRAEWRR